jgi:hypothetical protein
MKAALLVLVVGLLLWAGCTGAKHSSVNTVTNKLNQTQAIQVVSQLRYGMKWGDAAMILENKGLKSMGRAGTSLGWTHFYQLSDGCTLNVDIAPERARAYDVQAEGLLQSASIVSNGITVVSIKLMDAP